MKQAGHDAFEKELDNYEQIKPVGNAYINKRECSIYGWSVQYPGQCFRKIFPGVIFANRSVPEKCFRLCLNYRRL